MTGAEQATQLFGGTSGDPLPPPVSTDAVLAEQLFPEEDPETLRLKTSLNLGSKKPALAAQEQLRLQQQTGLPTDFIERHTDTVKGALQSQSLDVEALRKTSPSFAGWLAEHPDHASAAAAELPHLNYIERQVRFLGANVDIGRLQNELTDLGTKSMLETITPEDRAQQQVLESQLQSLQKLGDQTDALFAIPGYTAQQIPLLLRTAKEGFKGGAAGLAMGGVAGGLTAGLPGALAGGLAMMGPGAMVGAAREVANIEMAQAMLDYEKLKDDNGLPLDRTTAKGLALMAGSANGALEVLFGLEALALKVPGVRNFTKDGLKQLLKTPTTRGALLHFAQRVGTVMATEGVTEAMQMYVTKLGGALGQSLQDGGSVVDRVLTLENLKQAGQEAKAGALGGGGVAIPLATPQLLSEIRQVQQAKRTQQAFQSIGAVVQDSTLREGLPGTLRTILNNATKGGPVETLYVPTEAFNTYFQEAGQDPREAAQQITGDVEAYDLAQTTGSELAIKTADYVEHLAGTPANAALSPVLRTSLGAMNATEAEAWAQRHLDEAAQAKKQAEQQEGQEEQRGVRHQIGAMLSRIGFDPAVIEHYAQLFESRYQARASRRQLGETAAALFERQNLEVSRPVTDSLRALEGNVTELDTLLDRLRNQNIPKEPDIYGPSLFEALRELGGLAPVGEVTDLDLDKNNLPFQKSLIQSTGLSLDRATELMSEAGYIDDRSIESFLVAVNKEAAGRPVYVPGRENATALDLSTKLQDLAGYLKDQGINLQQVPNEAVKTQLGESIARTPAPLEGTTYEQDGAFAPTFYSKIEAVIEEHMGRKMPVKDLRGLLKARGVKPAEMYWTNLDAYLDAHEVVVKADLMAFLARNRIVAVPRILSDEVPPGMSGEEFLEKYDDEVRALRALGWDTTLNEEEDGTLGAIGFMALDDPDAEIVLWNDIPAVKAPAGQAVPALPVPVAPPAAPTRLSDQAIRNGLGQPETIRRNDNGEFPAGRLADYYLEAGQFGPEVERIIGFSIGEDRVSMYLEREVTPAGVTRQFVIPTPGADLYADGIIEARRILWEEVVVAERLGRPPMVELPAARQKPSDQEVHEALGDADVIERFGAGNMFDVDELEYIGLARVDVPDSVIRIYVHEVKDDAGLDRFGYYWWQEAQAGHAQYPYPYRVKTSHGWEGAQSVSDARRILYVDLVEGSTAAAPTTTPTVQPRALARELEKLLKAEVGRVRNPEHPVQYPQASLREPGGENYREILLMLQGTDTEFNLDDPYKGGHYGSHPNVVVHLRLDDRVDTRGRKLLFVQEIQSDWHQLAREVRNTEIDRIAAEQGVKPGSLAYKSLTAPLDIKQIARDTGVEPGSPEYTALAEQVASFGPPVDKLFGYKKKWAEADVLKFRVMTPPRGITGGDAYGATTSTLSGGRTQGDYVVVDGDGNVLATPARRGQTAAGALALIQGAARTGTLFSDGKLPHAPFSASGEYSGLALKWALRHAAEGQYDVLAWTTGAMQAARYRFSEHYEGLAYQRNEDGSWHLYLKQVDGELIDKVGDGGNLRNDFRAVPNEALAATVGQTMASQMRAGYETQTSATAPTEPALNTIERAARGELIQGVAEMAAHRIEAPFGIQWRDGSVSGFKSIEAAMARLMTQAEKNFPGSTSGPSSRSPLLSKDKKWDGYKAITGVDLDVGGAGMKGIYDKVVPNTLNVILRPWHLEVVGKHEGETLTSPIELPGTVAGKVEVPHFRPFDPGDIDGHEGAGDWSETDPALTAEADFIIGGRLVEGATVVVDKNGMQVMGTNENDEPWAYVLPLDQQGGVVSRLNWGTGESAMRIVRGQWGYAGSEFWRSMTPILSDAWVGMTREERDSIGPGQRSVNVRPVQGVILSAELKQSVLERGQTFYQAKDGDRAKGQIVFGAGRIDISLLERADLSTFLHEMGHLFLNEMVEDAFTPGVPAQLGQDLDGILKWMGVTARVADGLGAVTAAIGKVQHEQFARGFEAWLLEGKSPSIALLQAFFRFRQWLVWVYKLMTGKLGASPEGIGQALNVKLTPEVRKVMARLVATEEEIAAMEQEADLQPFFATAEDAGMSAREFADYKGLVARASQTARDLLQSRLMAQLTRERTDWWREKRLEVMAQVEAEANESREYIALAVLQTGMMPNGEALPEDVLPGKLSRKAVAKVLGKDFLKRMPKKTMTSDGGFTPEHGVDLFGYSSPEEFLLALVNTVPKQRHIETETDLRMVQQYGDPLIDGSLHEEARAAVQNDDRMLVLAAELEAIHKKQREVEPFLAGQREEAKAGQRKGREIVAALVPPMDMVRRIAKGQIAGTKLRDIKPYRHYLDAQKASKEATKALQAGDWLRAGMMKQRELLNLALFREATAAMEEAESFAEHMRELRLGPAQQRLGKAGADYLEQINALMERYEFAPVRQKDLARRQTLREWIAEKEAEGETLGEEFTVPEAVLREAQQVNYKELAYETLLGLRDTVRQIEHFARLKNKLIALEAKRDKDQAREALIEAVRMNVGRRPPGALTKAGMTRREKLSALAAAYDASLLKTELVVEWLDGGPTGPWHDHFWNPVVRAQNEENEYTERITAKIAQAVMELPKSIREAMLDVVPEPSIEKRIVRKDLLGIALNVGNESNRTKLLKGEQWDDLTLRRVLDHLTAEEWTFVQSIWDVLESMKPDVDALQKALTGVGIVAIQATPIVTKHGQRLRGGYYPVMYAAVSSSQGKLQLSDTVGKPMEGTYVRATLPSGHRKARVENFSAPFDFDIDRLPSHIAGVLHDLTHRRWMMDAKWITEDRAILATLIEHVGPDLADRLSGWVAQVTNDRNVNSQASLDRWHRLISAFRMNTVIVAMGFKFSTLASQLAGVAPAIEVLGGKAGGGTRWFMIGVADSLRRPAQTYAFMTEKSGQMKHWFKTRDLDIRDKLRLLEGRTDHLAELQRVSLMGIGYMELMISMPTWIGGYKRALHEGQSDEQAVKAGDRAVRLSQGSAGAKDLAAVVTRSDTFMRLITMFYTPFSALYNRLRSIGHDTDGLDDLPRTAVRLFLTVTMAATLGELLAGHGPDKDEPWWKWWIRVQALYPFLAVPLLRDAISTAVTGYGYQFSPVAQAIETGSRLTKGMIKAVHGEKEWEELAGQSLKAFSYFVGLPTSQIVITGTYLRDLATGQESPDDLLEFAKKFLYVRPKE